MHESTHTQKSALNPRTKIFLAAGNILERKPDIPPITSKKKTWRDPRAQGGLRLI
jgi:hypothetical protein